LKGETGDEQQFEEDDMLKLTDEEKNDIFNSIDMEQIRTDVFKLYDIKFGLSTELSLRKC
jgi:hypothetical protein